MTFEEWLGISDAERSQILGAWNAYGGEGEDIVRAAAEEFARRIVADSDVDVGHGIYHGGEWTIRAIVPFIFDNRRLPESFLGITVRRFTKDLPAEFQVSDPRKEYVWAPERYEAFVDRAADEIRAKFRAPEMSRKDMLVALCGEDFDAFKERCRVWEREGKIPPYAKPAR